MLYSPPFTFSSRYPLDVLLRVGLRLSGLRKFQAFLASSACWACADSYHFASIASPRWRSAFRSLRPSSSWGFPFWRLCLTVQSSRPAFGGRLTFGVMPHETFLWLSKRLASTQVNSSNTTSGRNNSGL